MSATKRYYEDLVSIVTDSLYHESLDMGEIQYLTKMEIEDATWDAITSDCLDIVRDDLVERFTNEMDMPLTARAIATLNGHLNAQ